MEDVKTYSSSLMEKNKRAREKAIWSNPEMKEFRESIKSRHGVDIKDNKAFPVGDPNFSWSSFRNKVMRETNVSSGNVQLLRAGVQAAVNNLYSSVPVTYDSWAHVIASQRNTELYAPLNALTFPGETGEGERYLESSVVGLDIKLNNKKFGQMLPVSFELIEDDQTGQFQQKVQEMAEYAALVWEVYAYGKFLSPMGGCTYGGLSVPQSETQPASEANYPWSTALVGGGANRPSGYAAMDVTTIQAGYVALEEQLNLQGLKMNVQPDTIMTGPFNRWVLATILNSAFYPDSGGAGALAQNVLQGIAKPVISRFMFDNDGSSANSKAWAILDTKKPAFIVQMREAAKVVQEDPLSGAGFERDIYRYKLSLRGNADFIDPRFFYLGNDGSAS